MLRKKPDSEVHKNAPGGLTENFRQLLEAAPDSVVIADGQGRIVLVNAQTEKVFGYQREELLGQPVEILIPRRFHHSHARHRERYQGAPYMRHVGYGLDLYGRRKSGEEFPVEVSLSPLKTAGGLLVISAIRDITDRKRVEAELCALKKDLERRVNQRTAQLQFSMQELSAFMYSVSHDLRAPLRQIDGFAKILMEDCLERLDPASQLSLQRIRAAARHMSQLMDDLLNLSRIGQQSMHLVETELDDLVRQTIAELEPESGGREIEWRVGSLPAVLCDPRLLRQVFINLLANAMKFTRTRPHAVIEVGCSLSGKEHIVMVRDNGVGFDMKYADKLFGVFQRLHAGEEFEGTGVGLAIAQRIVRKHGGRIWAESEPEHGATFHFTLWSGEESLSPEEALQSWATTR